MSGIARTAATGGGAMLPELLAWSSSFALDLNMIREDIVGSLAHVTMLSRAKIVPVGEARAIRDALVAMLDESERGQLALPANEEDVHMAVEAELTRRIGAVAGYLHTARSRNDQVALDLRLHVREQLTALLDELCTFIDTILARASLESSVLAAYTHRQRAQPIRASFLLCAWATQLTRAAELVAFTLTRLRESPLGSGACSGTSLPIDRKLTASLLGFRGPTLNALDTVGDRDFALDYVWAASRVLLALSKIAADAIDFSTTEFGLISLDGSIAAGSSMMPQKKNPDIFELVRGKASRGIGNVVTLMTLMKGLPSGYNRDQQEDRAPVIETGALVRGAVRAMQLAVGHVTFNEARGYASVSDGFTQATDLAEALVRRGVPFREAYRAVGECVRRAIAIGCALTDLPLDVAKTVHPMFDDDVLRALEPEAAIDAKKSLGGTGAESIAMQVAELQAGLTSLRAACEAAPRIAAIALTLRSVPLESNDL